MKIGTKSALIIALLATCQLSRAETTVKTNSDDLQIELVFSGWGIPGLGDNILCGLTDLTSDRIISVVYQPEPLYGCRFELFDTNGVAVPKTELGKTEGAFFSDLDPEVGLKESSVKFEPRPAFINTHMAPVNLVYNGNEIKAHKCNFTGGFARGLDQRRPLDNFCIFNAGEYKLKLTYQFFELVGNKSLRLVRFPTIEQRITVTSEDLKAAETTTMHKTILSSASTSPPARVKVVLPYQIESSKTLDASHPSLTFAGYNTPDAALETWLWASSRADKTNMLQSLTPDAQMEIKSSFDRLTDAQIKEIEQMSAQFPGYTVRKMETVSDTEVILSFILNGSDAVQKVIIKKVGSEWKVAGPSSDSAVISTSVPARKIHAEKN
jgi:hypothetical protein